MRKQTKVLAAAALFTLGASFSAFAAKTGTWALEDEGWTCYDSKNDQNYSDTFCLSGGKEFWVGSDEVIETSKWVEFEDNYYYVGSDGSKTINDWRFVAPHDDEDEDEQWFYFNASGKMVTGKKVINGKTYYFDGEGAMLTGWVDTENSAEATEDTDVKKLAFCNEDGSRVSKEWVHTYAPGVDEDEDDVDEDDMNWYYCNNKGVPQTGKQSNIKGQTYFFSNKGVMLTGWVGTTDNETYAEIGVEGQEAGLSSYKAVYFCGDEDDGHAKKNKWIKEWRNTQYDAADADNSKKWFWIAKNGEVYVPSATESNAAKADTLTFDDGEKAKDDWYSVDVANTAMVTKTINSKVYAFNKNGEMLSGLVKTEAGNVYYYGGSDDGVRKTGNVTIEDENGENYKFYFNTETASKGIGFTGNKSGKLYNQGILVSAIDYKYADVKVDGHDYIVNTNGSIQSSNKEYKDGDVVIKNLKTGYDFVKTGTTKGSYFEKN